MSFSCNATRWLKPKPMPACLFAMAIALAATGCTAPVPPPSPDYAGAWESPVMRLRISADGSRVDYWRRVGKTGHEKIVAPIQAVEGQGFVVGLGPIRRKFDVSVPPHAAGGGWRMTVDGIELARTADATSLPADAAP